MWTIEECVRRRVRIGRFSWKSETPLYCHTAFKTDSNSHGCVAGAKHTLCITSRLVPHRCKAALSERILL